MILERPDGISSNTDGSEEVEGVRISNRFSRRSVDPVRSKLGVAN